MPTKTGNILTERSAAALPVLRMRDASNLLLDFYLLRSGSAGSAPLFMNEILFSMSGRALRDEMLRSSVIRDRPERMKAPIEHFLLTQEKKKARDGERTAIETFIILSFRRRFHTGVRLPILSIVENQRNTNSLAARERGGERSERRKSLTQKQRVHRKLA